MPRALPEPLRAKFDAYLRGGGGISDVRRGGEFESFFSPEEKHAIIEAKLAAHDRVIADIDALCAGEKKNVCETHLGKYTSEQATIVTLIESLRRLAERSEPWRGEILDKVRTFELGWSGVEHEVRAEDVRGEIDYYHGVIE